ncbi:hypothetical protein JGG47_23425 [Salmonella enterica subsp. enterica serovar Derby]|nr:hypothetical protein [Salmonella enterica subsp. enterica serovar Derby]
MVKLESWAIFKDRLSNRRSSSRRIKFFNNWRKNAIALFCRFSGEEKSSEEPKRPPCGFLESISEKGGASKKKKKRLSTSKSNRQTTYCIGEIYFSHLLRDVRCAKLYCVSKKRLENALSGRVRNTFALCSLYWETILFPVASSVFGTDFLLIRTQ